MEVLHPLSRRCFKVETAHAHDGWDSSRMAGRFDSGVLH